MAGNLDSITGALKRVKPFKVKADVHLPSKATIKESGADYDKARKAISQGTLRGSTTVEKELPGYLSDAMASKVWGPFSPKFPYYRKNGEPANSGMRDLIDMGGLHDSLSIKTTFLQTKAVTTIQYSAPYARLVHAGGVIQPYGNPNAASVILPARPWITSTLKPGGPTAYYDYMKVYNSEIASAWNS